MFERALKQWLEQDVELSHLIGEIHNARRPQGDSSSIQITITKLGGGHFQDIPGEGACIQPTLQIEAYSNDNTAPAKCKRAIEAIRERLCGDNAVRWQVMGTAPDQYQFISATTERDSDGFPTSPGDGSDNYTFAPSVDIRATVRKL